MSLFVVAPNPTVVFFRQRACSEGYSLIYAHVISYLRGFSDHYSSAVIYEEIFTYCRSRVNIDPGSAMGPLGHYPRHQRNIHLVQLMGDTISSDSFDARIAQHDLIQALSRRISHVGRLHISFNFFTDLRHGLQQFQCGQFRHAVAVVCRAAGPFAFVAQASLDLFGEMFEHLVE